jgi:hypothetical protein
MKNDTTEIRVLHDDELDIVNGGIINGCIRIPGLPDLIMPPTGPGYVDQFASRLPSWVRPL